MSFTKQVFLTLGCLAILASYPLLQTGDNRVIVSVVIGAILATVNVLIGYGAIEYSFNKPATFFLMVVLGGMGIRMFVLLGILLILIGFAGFDVIPLVSSLGVCYVAFLILEVIFINKKVHLRQE